MRINTNISAVNAQRNLQQTNMSLGKSLERLSSGLRINRAADDAAGLAVSEKLRAQINGLNQAMRNANDGISLVQTAEGALNEAHTILQRMRTLSNQAANSTLQDADRTQITTEFDQLRTELGRIASSIEFNGVKLLNGVVSVSASGVPAGVTASVYDQTVAAAGTATISVDNLAVDMSDDIGDQTVVVGITQGAVTQYQSLSITRVADTDAWTVNGDQTLDFSQVGIRLELTDATQYAADTGSGNTIDTDTITLTGAASSFTMQVGADGTTDSRITFSVGGVSATALGINASAVDTVTNAQAAITSLGTAIETVATSRASLGAVQNRLESTVNNLGVSAENLSAAQSRIRDADMAQEMVQFTRSQILLQAGTAMLAQANSAPQSVLSLLRG